METEISLRQAELDKLLTDILQAKVDKEQILADIEARRIIFSAEIVQRQANFEADLERQREVFKAELKQLGIDTQTHLEDNIAGLKREVGGLNIEIARARDALEQKI